MRAREHRQLTAMAKKVGKTNRHDTSKHTSITKHHSTTNNTMETRGKIWEDAPNSNT